MQYIHVNLNLFEHGNGLRNLQKTSVRMEYTVMCINPYLDNHSDIAFY
jgi:hypothetical protein